jgi:hypothetical protein
VAVSFIGGRKPMYSKKTTDLLEVTEKLDRAHLATFNNISFRSWWSVLLVGEATNLLQATAKLDHIMLYRAHLTIRFELTTLVVIGTDCIGSSK